jgi:hypothetical protein
MKITGENRSTREKTCPSATLSTTNPTLTDPGSIPGLRGERPATNRLSHGTALVIRLLIMSRSRYKQPKGTTLQRPTYRNMIIAILCKRKSYPTANNLFSYFFLANDVTAPSGPGPRHYRGFTITLRHTTLCRTPLDK